LVAQLQADLFDALHLIGVSAQKLRQQVIRQRLGGRPSSCYCDRPTWTCGHASSGAGSSDC
jgi:hypothetical protein